MKAFHSFIDKYQIFPKPFIYDEFAKYRISEFNKDEATLYFIAKTTQIEFIPDSFEILENFCIKGKFNIGGDIEEVMFSALKIWYEHDLIKSRFSTEEDFAQFAMSKWEVGVQGLSSGQKYQKVSTVSKERSNASYLHVNCGLAKVIKELADLSEELELIVTPYNLIQMFEMSCLKDIEVIYIGKSNDNTWKRVYNHNKWGLVTEHVEPHEVLLVYFIRLDKSVIESNLMGSVNVISRQESELSIQSATNVTEAALVKYFIRKKKFNNQLVGTKLKSLKSVSEKLASKGYNQIFVEVKLEGLFGNIGSEGVKASNSHTIKFEF